MTSVVSDSESSVAVTVAVPGTSPAARSVRLPPPDVPAVGGTIVPRVVEKSTPTPSAMPWSGMGLPLLSTMNVTVMSLVAPPVGIDVGFAASMVMVVHREASMEPVPPVSSQPGRFGLALQPHQLNVAVDVAVAVRLQAGAGRRGDPVAMGLELVVERAVGDGDPVAPEVVQVVERDDGAADTVGGVRADPHAVPAAGDGVALDVRERAAGDHDAGVGDAADVVAGHGRPRDRPGPQEHPVVARHVVEDLVVVRTVEIDGRRVAPEHVVAREARLADLADRHGVVAEQALFGGHRDRPVGVDAARQVLDDRVGDARREPAGGVLDPGAAAGPGRGPTLMPIRLKPNASTLTAGSPATPTIAPRRRLRVTGTRGPCRRRKARSTPAACPPPRTRRRCPPRR